MIAIKKMFTYPIKRLFSIGRPTFIKSSIEAETLQGPRLSKKHRQNPLQAEEESEEEDGLQDTPPVSPKNKKKTPLSRRNSVSSVSTNEEVELGDVRLRGFFGFGKKK